MLYIRSTLQSRNKKWSVFLVYVVPNKLASKARPKLTMTYAKVDFRKSVLDPSAAFSE